MKLQICFGKHVSLHVKRVYSKLTLTCFDADVNTEFILVLFDSYMCKASHKRKRDKINPLVLNSYLNLFKYV